MGVARAACFELLAGVFDSSVALKQLNRESIRKRAGISGWEELNEGSYPEKRQESRMGYHFRGDPSGKRLGFPDERDLIDVRPFFGRFNFRY